MAIGRLKMMITGSGITTPYITGMYHDTDIETIEDSSTFWTTENTDRLDSREKKPYHDLVEYSMVFSTKVLKFSDSDPYSNTEPYYTRKCEIVGANDIWVEVGFFKENNPNWGDMTRIMFRTNVYNNGTWSVTNWGYGNVYSVTPHIIRWNLKDGYEYDCNSFKSELGHIDVDGNLFVDMIFSLFRSTKKSYRNYIGWCFLAQKHLSDSYPWYEDGKHYVKKGVVFYRVNGSTSDRDYILSLLESAQVPDFPYTDTDTDGGEGNQDNTSDDIDIPVTPTDVDSQIRTQGMVGVYKITTSASTLLCDFLYNNNVFSALVKKMYNNPIDAIMDYFYIPIQPKVRTSGHIGLCGMDTGISAEIVSSMYSEFDFGTLDIAEYYGDFLDYEPYTNISIYLPFVGIRQLNANLYMNSTLHIVYRVDVMTGCFVAYLEVTQKTQWGVRKQMVNSFSGNMAIHLPLTNVSNTMFTQSMITGLSGVASGTTQIALGNPTGAITATSGLFNMGASAYMGGTSLETVSRYDGNIGFLGVMYPYLIIERPVANIPFNYGRYNGYNSFIERKLSDISGYTKVQSIHLDGIVGILDSERQELEKILKDGIVI